METQNLKFVNKSPNPDPSYAHDGDSGFDLRAWIKGDEPNVFIDIDYMYGIILKPLERCLVHTGLHFELPEHTEMQVRPRSGASLKQGLTVLNAPGTVDNKYIGEVCVIAYNSSHKDIIIKTGDRIAQAVLCPVYLKELVNLSKVTNLDETERGADGFGSTGVN